MNNWHEAEPDCTGCDQPGYPKKCYCGGLIHGERRASRPPVVACNGCHNPRPAKEGE